MQGVLQRLFQYRVAWRVMRSSKFRTSNQALWDCFTYKPPFGGFPKLGVPFGGPSNKGYSILGSILGSPNFGKLPFGVSLGFRV